MPEDGSKAMVGVGLAGIVGGLIYAITKKKKPPPEEVVGARVQIDIVGVESHSPFELMEGKPYTLRLSVANLSVKAGTPIEAVFDICTSAGIDSIELIPTQCKKNEHFYPSTIRAFTWPLNIPAGTGGKSGWIFGTVFVSATGKKIAEASEKLIIIAPEIIYGADIGIDVG